MTDKEILAKIYDWIKLSNSRDENPDHTRQRLKDFQAFIEQEWQREDDRVTLAMYNRNREPKDHVSNVDEMSKANAKSLGQFSDSWYSSDPCTNDIKEIERHRALEIGEDGTVKELK